MFDGFEPHDTIYSVGLTARGYTCCCMTGGGGGVYPGWGMAGWVLGGAIPVPYPDPSQDPIFNIFLRLGPTHGQMKVKLSYSMRFPR